MPKADIFAGLFGGLSQGLGQIQEQRIQKAQEQRHERSLQLQQKEAERIAQRAKLEDFMLRLTTTPPDTDIDPTIAQEGATMGLSHLFTRGPSGAPRRVLTTDEKADQLKLEAAQHNAGTARYEFNRAQALADPSLADKLLGVPDIAKRTVMAAQLGINKVPLTEIEQRRQLEMEKETNPMYASYKEMLRLGNQQPRAGSGGGVGGVELSPNQTRDLGKFRSEAMNKPTDWSLGLPEMLGGKGLIQTGPSQEMGNFRAQLSQHYGQQVVSDAFKLVEGNPNANTEQILQIAARLPGFDPRLDGPKLGQVLIQILGK